MDIIAIRAETGSGSTVARFDAQLTPDIRMMGLKLVKTIRGHRVYAPQTSSSNCASFSPAFAEQLTRAALAALTGETDGIDAQHAA